LNWRGVHDRHRQSVEPGGEPPAGAPVTTGTPQGEPRRVPCPTCKRPAVFAPSNPSRPFCSERCRGVDLGAWANESYRVEVPPGRDDDDTLPD
jgi:endogenous inhibitor of DNA gyrase (YacG/DUF329 family)